MKQLTSLARQGRYRKVIPAPKWLAQRMQALQQLPPPTLKEVETHFKASAEIRKQLTAKRNA